MATWEDILANAKILVVDDDPVMIKLCSAMLEKAGYKRVWSTQQPSEAVNLFREIAPDLVLLDMHMAPLNGIEVMEQLRGETPEGEYVPIVVITADVSKPLRLEALAKGAKDFMTKPVEWSEAMLRIRSRLESRFRFVEMQQTIQQLRQATESRSAESATVTANRTNVDQRSVRPEYSKVPPTELLLKRLDSIGELIDQENYREARERLRGTRWLADIGPEDLPVAVLKRAQQWIDTGYDALAGSHLDPGLARNALLEVRRVINA